MEGSRCALSEPALTMTEAAAYIGDLTGKRPSSSTCWRWAMRGVRGCRLNTQIVGGTLYTTKTWVEEFLAAGQQRIPGVPRPHREPRNDPRHDVRRGHQNLPVNPSSLSSERAKQQLDALCNPSRATNGSSVF